MTTTEIPFPKSDQITAIKVLFNLPQAQAMLLSLLLERNVTSVEDIRDAGVAPTIESARVVVHRLRNFFKKKKIKLKVVYSTGYWIAPEDKLILTKAINAFNYPER